jgi:uncharacterized DUF497 family protein
MVVDGFEWDDAKAASNEQDHGVTFGQAIVALTDVHALEFPSRNDSSRVVTIGFEPVSGVLVVVTTEVGENTRIISAWKAEPAERRAYHNTRRA